MIDPETNERKRDEMIPIRYVDGSKSKEENDKQGSRSWQKSKKITSHIITLSEMVQC